MTILRLQRDEFLPLRVIRDELAIPGASERKRRRPAALGERVEAIEFEELCRRSGVQPEFAKELDEFGLLSPAGSGADKRYPETDVDIAIVCAQLTRFGIDGRHLRTFRTATDRESALLEQLIAPALRSRNAERHAAGLTTCSRSPSWHRSSPRLLLWREVREIACDMTGVDLQQQDPRGRRLPDTGSRLQGHHAAARRSGGAPPDDSSTSRSGSRRRTPTS